MYKYQHHPDVAAVMDTKGDNDESSGDESDPIVIAKSKTHTIKNWMKTPASVCDIVESHMHRARGVEGAFTERSLRYPWLWINSEIESCSEDSGVGLPAEGEQYICVNWKLPLGELGQRLLFYRWTKDYERTSKTVKQTLRWKCRKSEKEIFDLRCVAGLWQQASEFFKSELTGEDYNTMYEEVWNKETGDAELLSVIATKPQKFSISMLPTYRKIMLDLLAKRSQEITHEVETQQDDVRQAQWKYFSSALHRDWERLAGIPLAIKEAKNIAHEAYVKWLDSQVTKAHQGVETWCDRRCKLHLNAKPTSITKPFTDMKRSIWTKHNCKDQDIWVIVLCDANVPNGQLKEHVRYFAESAKVICDMNPSRSVCAITLPDVPSESSAKGLDDEEKKWKDQLQEVGHTFDTRYIINIKPPPGQTKLREWSQGRLSAFFDEDEENMWLAHSNLSIKGRPHTEVVMPDGKCLSTPEDLEPNKDIRLSDRKRWHVEQVVAQKGPEFVKLLIKSLASGMDFADNTPLIIANLTPFVEDAGRAIVQMITSMDDDWHLKSSTYYISLHQNKTHLEWSKQKLRDILENLWIKGQLHTPGFVLEGSAPTVSTMHLPKKMGQRGDVALGNLDVLGLEILVRDGMELKIKDEHIAR